MKSENKERHFVSIKRRLSIIMKMLSEIKKEQTKQSKKYFRPDELEIFGISAEKARDLYRKGILRGIKRNSKTILIPADAVSEYLESCKKSPDTIKIVEI